MIQPPQELLVVFDRRPLGDHPAVEFGRIVRRVIARPVVLQPGSRGSRRVEHRRPRRQRLQAQPVGEVVRESMDRVALGPRAAVPDDPEPPARVAPHRLQERRHGPVVEGPVDPRLGVQAEAVAPRREPWGRRDRDLVAGAAAPLDEVGGPPRRRPGPPRPRGPRPPARGDRGDPGPPPPGFSSIRGQSEAGPAALASGSRSRGARRGARGVNPRRRSQTVLGFGWSSTPNACRIGRATCGPVPRSVGRPGSVGLSANQRRTPFSWGRVNLGGRPAPPRPAPLRGAAGRGGAGRQAGAAPGAERGHPTRDGRSSDGRPGTRRPLRSGLPRRPAARPSDCQ